MNLLFVPNSLNQDVVYYCFYVKFSKSGFTKKIPPTPVYIKKFTGSNYFEIYEDKSLSGCFLLSSYNFCHEGCYSGLYDNIEDCINEFNKCIRDRIELVESNYKKQIDRLKNNIIIL